MKVFGTLALSLLAACATVSTQPLGTAPTYVEAVSRDVPNEAAIVLATHDMVAGLEDLDFDARGRLWGVSESGTRKYIDWPTRFPFVIAIDTGRLQ